MKSLFFKDKNYKSNKKVVLGNKNTLRSLKWQDPIFVPVSGGR